jgi:ATPase subunit of ABC transporter with duplicated ATPase domains
MLSIESIDKGFGDQVLFEDASLQINPGERVGLVGRNGHGKTTLLNMIAGTDHPDDGKIITGKRKKSWPDWAFPYQTWTGTRTSSQAGSRYG